jgi:lipopolysaccharide/colanic/teichoic acid biosynthesis glycosyltransferase
VAKRILDVLGSILGLVLFAPLFLIISILIKLDSHGPTFFVQTRLGKGAEPFEMYKFRTMVVNAEGMSTGLYSYADDDRITRVGRFLRQISADELPQLFNVLLGSMSLVGPRPPVSYELGPVEEFSDTTKIRFLVKPGITGLAQISGRNDLSWPEKIAFDNEYVESWKRQGIWLDLKILLSTVWTVLSARSVVEPNRGEKQ